MLHLDDNILCPIEMSPNSEHPEGGYLVRIAMIGVGRSTRRRIRYSRPASCERPPRRNRKKSIILARILPSISSQRRLGLSACEELAAARSL